MDKYNNNVIFVCTVSLDNLKNQQQKGTFFQIKGLHVIHFTKLNNKNSALNVFLIRTCDHKLDRAHEFNQIFVIKHYLQTLHHIAIKNLQLPVSSFNPIVIVNLGTRNE